MINPKYQNTSQLKKKFLAAKPFPHLVLKNFFSKKINKVIPALLKEHCQYMNSDLYQFHQTDDCKNATQETVKEFHKYFSSQEFIQHIAKITGKKLKSIDMSGFIYTDTDYLLPHDDRLEGRKIAYVVNLSKNFKKSDGGELQLFSKNKVVKSITPTYNTLTIFEVSSKSLHQVQEVFSNKKRITLSGWFHG